MWVKRLAIIAATVLIAQPYVLAQSPSTVPAPTPREWEELRSRSQAIEEELKQPLNVEWAGAYESGDIGFSGVSLLIAPKHGFVRSRYSDLSPEPLPSFDFGEVSMGEDGILRLTGTRGYLASKEFFFVPWGERHFLVPVEEIRAFVNVVNAGCDQVTDARQLVSLKFPSKEGEFRKRLFGIPKLPAAFANLILKSPIKAVMKTVGGRTLTKYSPTSSLWSRTTKITIDRGHSDGVWEGMYFFLISKDGSKVIGNAIVKTVSAHSADAETRDSFEGEEPPLPTIGTRMTTRFKLSWFSRYSGPDICS